MQQKITCFLLLLFCSTLLSQINIKGKIIDSLDVVPDAHIVNLTTKKGTISNSNGEFELLVSVGDEIEVTSIQHHTAIATVANITIRAQEMNIKLKIKTYQLDEFQLKKTDLMGSLGIDIKDVPKSPYPKIDAVTLGLPGAGQRKLTQIERKIRTATSASGGIPLDLFLNIMSGRLSKLKEEQQVVGENQDVAYMYDNYRYFVQDYYGIKKDEVYRFFYFCLSDPTYSRFRLRNELKMINFLKLMSSKFKDKKR